MLKERRSPHHGGPQHSVHWYCGSNTLLLLLVVTRCAASPLEESVKASNGLYTNEDEMLLIHLTQGAEKRKFLMIHPPFALIPWGIACMWGKSSTKSRIKTWLLRISSLVHLLEKLVQDISRQNTRMLVKKTQQPTKTLGTKINGTVLVRGTKSLTCTFIVQYHHVHTTNTSTAFYNT